MTDPRGPTMNEPPAVPVLDARGIRREFREGPSMLTVLQEVNLRIDAGERLAIVGASGSGKTTLLQILGGLDRPSAGSVAITGQDIHAVDGRARGELRNRTLGVVYQFHPLLPEFSALENVAMPLLVRRTPVAQARQRATELLGRVGVGGRLEHRPHQLSGGQRPRAAVARALVTEPRPQRGTGLRPDARAEPRTADQPGDRDPRHAPRGADGPRADARVGESGRRGPIRRLRRRAARGIS